MPGKWKSEVYCAFPLTFKGPSTRATLRPIDEVPRISCVVAMFDPSVKSACERRLQGVRKAAPGQIDLECVLALWLGVAQGRLRRLSEVRSVCGLTGERGFGLVGSPGFGADATEGDACPGHVLAGDRDHDRGRGQGELVSRPVAQFQIHLLAARDGHGKREVRDKVARLKHRFAVRRVAGQEMKVSDGDCARAFRPQYVNGRFTNEAIPGGSPRRLPR